LGQPSEPVDEGFPVHEPPDVSIKRAKRFARVEERLRIADCRGNLQAVPDDPGVAEQSRRIPFAIARDAPGIKCVKGLAKVVALLQHDVP
jgi:hypothetical protein